MKKTKSHIGSSFEDFLREEGIHEEVEQLATKKLIALQLKEQMKAAKLSKSAMAKRLDTSRSQLDRVLDPENNAVTLATLSRAAHAIGKRLRVTLETVA
jgi:antitoxin HicB